MVARMESYTKLCEMLCQINVGWCGREMKFCEFEWARTNFVPRPFVGHLLEKSALPKSVSACFLRVSSPFYWEMSTRVKQESSWITTSVIINVHIKRCANCTLQYNLFSLAASHDWWAGLYSLIIDADPFPNAAWLIWAPMNRRKLNEIHPSKFIHLIGVVVRWLAHFNWASKKSDGVRCARVIWLCRHSSQTRFRFNWLVPYAHSKHWVLHRISFGTTIEIQDSHFPFWFAFFFSA